MKNLLIALFLFGSLVLKAQDSTTYVNVALKNGNSVSGQLLHKSDAEVSILTTDLGTVMLPWSAIESVNVISKQEIHQFANPQPTRYFFAPSAIPLKKGDKYYQRFSILLICLLFGPASVRLKPRSRSSQEEHFLMST
jgi:hypothetical protein